jgi:hypothetical protein
MGVKVGLLTLTEEHRLNVFEDRELRRIFCSDSEVVNFIICSLHQILGLSNEEASDGRDI